MIFGVCTPYLYYIRNNKACTEYSDNLKEGEDLSFKNYNEEHLKWFQNWEKNFETTLKAIKKFREEFDGRPNFTKTTAKKYALYFDLLEQEIIELKELYDEMEGGVVHNPIPKKPTN